MSVSCCKRDAASNDALQHEFDAIFLTYPLKHDGKSTRPVAQSSLSIGERQLQRFQHGAQLVELVAKMYDVAHDTGVPAVPAFVRDELLDRGVTAGEYYPVQILSALRMFLTHHPGAHRRRLLPLPLREQALFTRHHPAPAPHSLPPPLAPEDPEDVLRYFRDDYGLNAQHTNFHWVFFHRGIPADSVNPRACRRLTLPERQGEVQLFMHAQLLQRFKYERSAAGLPPLTPFTGAPGEWAAAHEPDPLLTTPTADWPWPYVARPAGELPSRLGVLGKGPEDISRMMHNLRRVVALGYVPEDNGSGMVPADSKGGEPLTAHLLGSLQENSLVAERWPSYFGWEAEGVHNSLHDALSLLGQGTASTAYNVLGSLQDALRDPLFYRIHAYLDELRRDFAARHLAPHRLEDYAPHGVRVDAFAVVAPRLQCSSNVLHTTLGAASDLYEAGRLDHEPFEWHLTLRLAAGAVPSNFITVRIFIAEEVHAGDPSAWLEMDKFCVILRSEGTEANASTDRVISVVRSDSASSVAVEERRRGDRTCMCGVPLHLLLPRGFRAGRRFVSTCVLTCGGIDEEAVEAVAGGCAETVVEGDAEVHEIRACASTAGGRFPDTLPMGYPFDRALHAVGEQQILDVLRGSPNVGLAHIRVFHSDVWSAEVAAPLADGATCDTRVAPGNAADIHVYFDKASEGVARSVRDEMIPLFPELRFFKVHQTPIGPHPCGMWEADFRNVAPESFSAVYGRAVAWLSLHRRGISVLVHPHTGNELLDHLRYAVWLGKPVELEATKLHGDFATDVHLDNVPIFS